MSRQRTAAAAPSTSALVFERLESRQLLSSYVVSTGGNDANPGTDAAPWRTLQRAANAVVAGDTVAVRAGAYQGFHLTRDGTAAAPIVFRADPGVTITAANATTGRDGINLEGADHVTVEGFTVTGMARAGIRSVTNHHVTIRNNVAQQNGYWGIFTGFSHDLLIEGNDTNRSVNEHGIYVSNSADRAVIRNNVTWGNSRCGIHMNGDASMGGDGMINDALVEGNVVHGNGATGGSGINGDGVTGSRIQNNVLYDNHASGISLYRIDGATGSTGNVVANNTIVMAADARWALNMQNASTGNTVFNNVLYNNQSYRGSLSISADSLAGLRSDHNAVMDRFTTDDGATRMSLAQWRAGTGQDQNSVVATPAQLFANVAGNDYRLAATSPAIDRGTASLNGHAAPAADRDGVARPSGAAFDVGAYEFVVAPPEPQPTAPAAPTALTATAASASRIDLRWSDNSGDETGFRVERKAGSAGTWSQIATVAANVTTYADAGLSAGTQYAYRVRATNAVGDSPYSGEASATTQTAAPAPTVPAAPDGLIAAASSAGAVQLSWADRSTDETGFRIERRTGTAAYAAVATVDAGVVSYTDASVAADTSYEYRVAALNAVGSSAYSNVATVKTPAAPAPEVGTGLRGEYFDNKDLTNLRFTRTDATVNVDWGKGSPDPRIGDNTFSVRWTGQVVPQFGETYTFYARSDDGVRLWVNGQQLINAWTDRTAAESRGSITLQAGQRYDIRLEYYENRNAAACQLSWSSASQAKQVVPQSRLFPPSTGATATGVASTQPATLFSSEPIAATSSVEDLVA